MKTVRAISGCFDKGISLGRILLAAVLLVLPLYGIAKAAPVSLVANSIHLDQNTGILSARGSVQVFFQDQTLTAAAIQYNQKTGVVTASGPITITSSNGTVLTAEYAELSDELREGLVQGARLLLADQLQLAATELRRVDGRFNTMTNVVASSCQVCAARPTPIWRIRARQVVHDDETRQIYFRNATFEVMGFPILYLPYLRIPDPEVRRASGLLSPIFLSSQSYGNGIKLPYFLVINDYSDATITPTITLEGAAVLDAEYRHRFKNGYLDVFGAFALKDNISAFSRGFVELNGSFNLQNDYVLDFAGISTSDGGFMRQFGYNDADRLVNEISVSRYQDKRYISLVGALLTSLRDDEDNNTIPIVVPEFTYRSYRNDPFLGGKLGYEVNSVGLFRQTGDDMFRVGATVDWNKPLILPFGLWAQGFAEADVDIYKVWNSVDFPEDLLIAANTSIGADIRWPLVRQTAGGRHVFEPIVQLVYTPNMGFNDEVPNEDSLLVEFDETNLFDINRFPGRDVTETGFRANLGASYTIYDDDGWSLGLTGGVVLRTEPSDQFSPDTLLGGSNSDFLAAVNLNLPPNLNVISRLLIDDHMAFKRSETEASLSFDRWDIGGTLVYLAADPLALSPVERGEGYMYGRYQINRNWEFDVNWQHDLIENTGVFAGAGLSYGNECIEIGISLSRRFTTSNIVPASTDIDLVIQLAGIGGNTQDKQPAARCMQ